MPSPNEQTQIAAFLDRETAKVDTRNTEAQRAIDLLQERRTALISTLVTGRINVRQLSQTQKVPEGTHRAGAGETANWSGECNAA